MNKISILLLCLFVHTGLMAQNFRPVADPEKVLQELRKTAQATSSIRAAYTEEKFLSVLKTPEQSSGLFYYQKSDKMRWEQKLPVKYVVLINGDKLRIAENGKEKNTGAAGRMADQIKSLMIGLVNGDFQENKAFALSCAENEAQHMVTLVPANRRMKNVYAKITLVFSKKTSRLKELSFYEKNGDHSVMHFQNEVFNEPIDNSLFSNL
ncbi:LolA family protein [Dyadobacter sandarakinus]|uniref:Outer membrane lipoprotein carrier protein LolA n=1 Tax=Dyadobacter sandarakinus TaxID=2747268 RepID=A0ABX7I4Z1_9BACT|nr:outer membrane lipoprotein carrier protein LolA [Dyadobacter sandarakinus]QRR00929.1 outer membrane lipoprotein carrier protein LolA [Dyadobacter sandarakinus]